jgi:ATP-dependent Clp protease ATP-binding subunit ClpC
MLVFGQEEARRLGHREIHSDHLLLGILRLPRDPLLGPMLEESGDRAAIALSSLGVSLEGAREVVAALRGGSAAATEGQLPMSTETRDVLGEGLKTALKHDSRTLEPTHFLLAMITVEPGPSAAAQVLDRLGVRNDELREGLKK